MALKHEKPGKELHRELVQLSIEASSLQGHLIEYNGFPLAFPKLQLENYCSIMSQLQNGTAEGCLEPLVFLFKELPRIRRKFILDEQTANEQDSVLGDDDVPSLRRGEETDDFIGKVILAISSTLDEYRDQSSSPAFKREELDKQPQRPTSGRYDPEIKISIESAKNLGDAVKSANECLDRNDKHADNFVRTLSDAKHATDLGNSAVEGKTVVPKWLKRISKKLKDYPKIIRKSGKLVRVSAAIAGPALERFNAWKGELIEFGVQQVDKIGQSLTQIADNLEALQNEEAKIVVTKKKWKVQADEFPKWTISTISRYGYGSKFLPYVMFQQCIREQIKLSPNEYSKQALNRKTPLAHIISLKTCKVVGNANDKSLTLYTDGELRDVAKTAKSRVLEAIIDIILPRLAKGTDIRRVRNKLKTTLTFDYYLACYDTSLSDLIKSDGRFEIISKKVMTGSPEMRLAQYRDYVHLKL